MGEIGISRKEYLYELTYTDLVLISRGYDRRHCHTWSATRWMTYNLMSAYIGGDKLAEHGIHGPKDLIKFPWEHEQPPLTQEEVKELLADIDAFNADLEKQRQAVNPCP